MKKDRIWQCQKVGIFLRNHQTHSQSGDEKSQIHSLNRLTSNQSSCRNIIWFYQLPQWEFNWLKRSHITIVDYNSRLTSLLQILLKSIRPLTIFTCRTTDWIINHFMPSENSDSPKRDRTVPAKLAPLPSKPNFLTGDMNTRPQDHSGASIRICQVFKCFLLMASYTSSPS